MAEAEKTRTAKKKKNRVIVFSTPTCSYCNMAKQYFRRNKIRFKDVDVSRDEAAARDLVRRTGQMGVPVIDINGKLIVGFDKPQINRLLDIKEN
ncbi:MAG: glutaredoxin family protein [Candidatus Promineifilaceae bacterium]|jgi:glutaredoxin 3